MKARENLIKELKEYREKLASPENKVTKGKQKVYTRYDKRGYTDALILSLLTGLASGIMIGISLMIYS